MCQKPPITDGWHACSMANLIQVVFKSQKLLAISDETRNLLCKFLSSCSEFSITLKEDWLLATSQRLDGKF